MTLLTCTPRFRDEVASVEQLPVLVTIREAIWQFEQPDGSIVQARRMGATWDFALFTYDADEDDWSEPDVVLTKEEAMPLLTLPLYE